MPRRSENTRDPGAAPASTWDLCGWWGPRQAKNRNGKEGDLGRDPGGHQPVTCVAPPEDGIGRKEDGQRESEQNQVHNVDTDTWQGHPQRQSKPHMNRSVGVTCDNTGHPPPNSGQSQKSQIPKMEEERLRAQPPRDQTTTLRWSGQLTQERHRMHPHLSDLQRTE